MESYFHVQWSASPGYKECLPRTYCLGQGGLFQQHLSGRSSFEFWKRWGTWGPWYGLWLGMGQGSGFTGVICSRYMYSFSLADSCNFHRFSMSLAKDLFIFKIKYYYTTLYPSIKSLGWIVFTFILFIKYHLHFSLSEFLPLSWALLQVSLRRGSLRQQRLVGESTSKTNFTLSSSHFCPALIAVTHTSWLKGNNCPPKKTSNVVQTGHGSTPLVPEGHSYNRRNWGGNDSSAAHTASEILIIP